MEKIMNTTICYWDYIRILDKHGSCCFGFSAQGYIPLQCSWLDNLEQTFTSIAIVLLMVNSVCIAVVSILSTTLIIVIMVSGQRIYQ